MQLVSIQDWTGTIELLTGLHIGCGKQEMHIGGMDNPVIKHPHTQEPYIPGSSIKGKIRSLLEWKFGLPAMTDGKPVSFQHLTKSNIPREKAEAILRLFGGAPGDSKEKQKNKEEDYDVVKKIGPSRLSFWDCSLDSNWVKKINDNNLPLTEVKMENSIDRIKGAATNPRNTERVPAGARFGFRMTLRVHDQDQLEDMVLLGLRLLELTGLGGSGSRGYGKLQFTELKKDGEDMLPRLHDVSVGK